MSLVLTQEGGAALWNQILGISSIGIPWVRLLGSPHTPAHTDTLAVLAPLELAVSGYAPIALQPLANWTVSQIAAGAQADYILLQWSLGAACTIYGYWLNDQPDDFSLVAEAFINPYVVPDGGGPFTLQLPLTLTSTP